MDFFVPHSWTTDLNHLFYDRLYNPTKLLSRRKARWRRSHYQNGLKMLRGVFAYNNNNEETKISDFRPCLHRSGLCGGYYMLGHALKPEGLYHTSRNTLLNFHNHAFWVISWTATVGTMASGALKDFWHWERRLMEMLHALTVAAVTFHPVK